MTLNHSLADTPIVAGKPPSDTRVVVAMSGGVDSSTVAAVLVEQGYDVIGVTLQLYDHGAKSCAKGTCCAGQDIYDARRVAEKLGIPHYVLDYETRFSSTVIDDFADSYMRGETPLPCVRCNQEVKFGDLLKTARDLGADAMATGHYARRLVGAHGAELHRAADADKDQSYFLFATTQEQLEYLRFPLGDLPKAQTRELAARYGLEVANKPDSQDICFVPDGDYATVVTALRPEAAKAGEIIDSHGTVLGRHEGIINFTIGQRRGLDIGRRSGETNAPLYVLRIDPATNRVIVGTREQLAVGTVHLRGINWLGEDVPSAGIDVTVRLRSSQAPVAAHFCLTDSRTGDLTLYQPTFGVAPGQAGVIYSGSRLLGGGWITSEKVV